MFEFSAPLSVAVHWLLTYAIHSSVLVCAVWLIATGLRGISDSTRDTLWKLALVGPLLSTSVQMVAGFEPGLGTLEVQTGVAAAAPPAVSTDDDVAVRRHTIVTQGGSVTFVVERDPGAEVAGAVNSSSTPAPVWPWVLIGVWGVGAFVALARLGLGIGKLRRMLRGRKEVLEDPVLESFLALCQRAELGRRVRLTAAPGLETPVALWRSEVCLPTRALVELHPHQIHAVLAHELAHLERRDPMWMTFASVLEAVFFFQPFNRLARRKLQETAEFLCDDWAVRHTGSGEYLATSLARVASWQGECVATPIAPGVMRPGRPFVQRVNRLLDASRDRRASDGGPAPVAAGVGLLGATMWLAPAVVEARSAPPSKPVVEARVVVDEVVEEEIEAEEDDPPAVVVVPDGCCGDHGRHHGHGHLHGRFGGSALRMFGGFGDPDLDFNFDIRIAVPDVHRERHRERHDRVRERLEREHDDEQEFVENLLLDVMDW